MFQFEGIKEVVIRKQGNGIIIMPKKPSWLSFADSDFMVECVELMGTDKGVFLMLLMFDADSCSYIIRLQSYLFKQRKPIGNNDTMIAAHAQRIQAVMVTNNHKYFSKVPDLHLENWANTIPNK